MGQKTCDKVQASPHAIVNANGLTYTLSLFLQLSLISDILGQTKIQMKMNIYPSVQVYKCTTQRLLKLNVCFFDNSTAHANLHRLHELTAVNTEFREITMDYSSTS